VNVEIMRTFVRLRQALAGHEELARKLDALESRYDHQFRAVFDAIRRLMTPPPSDRHQIGFTPSDGASETGDP
jgi:hypothetical protein